MLRKLILPECIGSAFRLAVENFATNTALVHDGRDFSYAELDRLSDLLAARLKDGGVKQGSLIGIAAQSDPLTIIALVATQKIGAGYVPLPNYYPDERLRVIARDAGLHVIVGAIAALEESGLTRIDFDWTSEAAAATPIRQPACEPSAVAYVMYTSGSTGAPKGVIVPQRAVLRLVCGQDFMDLGPDERILQASPIGFDAATLEIWGALLNGGALVLPDSSTKSLRALGSMIARHEITSLWLTAGLFHAMADERPGDLARLRQLLTGGDIVSPAKVAQVMAKCPDLTIINGYGPTENTTFTCCHQILRTDVEAGVPLPIGRPISGTEVFVLDAELQAVSPGEAGELCAAGAGLATGYLGDPDLTAEKFVSAPWDPGLTLYRTGDLVRRDDDGLLHYLGRIDTQVKLRGFRIELGEIEAATEDFAGIRQAVAMARSSREDVADKMLVVWLVADAEPDEAALKAHLAARLPDYAMPSRFLRLDRLPLNDNGKVDRRALEKRALPQAQPKPCPDVTPAESAGVIEDMIVAALADVLGTNSADLDRTANFFDLGASSLHIARVHERLQSALERNFVITDFFLHSTTATLAQHLSQAPSQPQKTRPASRTGTAGTGGDTDAGHIAIIGLAGRFPGAPDVATFWEGLVSGREMISHFSPEELDVDLSKADPEGHFVNARGVMPDADMFDARHFNIPPREAERMDPQHRILLEVAQTALDNAGHDPARFPGKVGIFAGSSQNSYLLNNLMSAPGASRKFAASYPLDDFSTLFGNDKDFIATRIAYKLNLRGPAATVLCACSTSLVAVAQACDALRGGTADMMLAGGVSVTFPAHRNYKYLPDGMASADGHCRTFDADATGTVFGDGAGIVVLRRLKDALEDGDEVIAVIRGSSINNDGAEKAGYAAPSIRAQAEVIRAAQSAAGVTPREIGYVETHGTATPLGDPIEFAALRDAFTADTEDRGFCALGSAKTNVGHLDIAAGVTGLIKAALTLKHGVIPPLLHYKTPNPRIDFAASPFYPATAVTRWPRTEVPRFAGVSAFGVGGTNIHMVLEEAPVPTASVRPSCTRSRVFPVSASTPEALAAACADLGNWAAANPDADPDGVAATLRNGRGSYGYRAVLVAKDMIGLSSKISAGAPRPVAAGRRDEVAFLFPGQGAQHVGMARELFASEPVFREALGLCADLLKPELGLDLLSVIHAPDADSKANEALKNTALAQPAIFSISYALAKQWDHWSVRPDVMIGHSIGEFAAATIAGVIGLEDALKLIALRGRLMADLPGGVMVSVRAAEDALKPWIGAGLDLAAVNGSKACVLAGPADAAAEILPQIEAAGIVTSRLHTSHAFHTHMMEPALATFREALAKLTFNAPAIPIVSTVTGEWLTESEAVDPCYWADHMRRPVRFYDAV
ncbi:amino acid adenylation domain-containing protein [Roseovarius sp. S1116L3]|uniref:amino acid adenylation domain-containing protein n=1 Tax=Roseovarius roseus TaxID=3342636 RepID=UPI00372C3A68